MIGYSVLIDYVKTTPAAFIVTNSYIYALAIFLAFFIIANLSAYIIREYVLFLTRKTKTDVDDKIAEGTKTPLFYILTTIGLFIGASQLPLSERAMFHIQNTIAAMIYIIASIMLSRVATVIIEYWGGKWAKRTKATLDDDLMPLLNKTVKVFIYIIALLIILKRWHIDITGLMAGLGIAGLAIGLALKDSLANLFGGISLILDKNVKVGDKIKLDNGITGIVKDIGLRSTRIRTFDNELIIVPNGNLANTQIQNFVLPEPKARVNVNFGVKYGSDVQEVKKIVTIAVKGIEHVIDEPPITVDFLEMGDFSLKFVCRIWVDSYKNSYSTKVKATELIYNALNKAKIEIPFPTQTVHVDKIK